MQWMVGWLREVEYDDVDNAQPTRTTRPALGPSSLRLTVGDGLRAAGSRKQNSTQVKINSSIQFRHKSPRHAYVRQAPQGPNSSDRPVAWQSPSIRR